MPRIKTEQTFEYLDTGKYVGFVSAIRKDAEKGTVKIWVDAQGGSASQQIRVDSDGNPCEGFPHSINTQKFLKACNIPSAEYWAMSEAERDADFDFEWDDMLDCQIYFTLKWSKVSAKYPNAYANFDKIMAATDMPKGTELGPDHIAAPIAAAEETPF